MTTAIALRELDLDALFLHSGSHRPGGEMCVMEAVAFVAGEPWSDRPECACPVIAAFLRKWNDDLDDADRQILKPFIRRLVGTKAAKDIETRRGWMLVDWMVRTHTPAWLELAGLKEQADALTALPPIADIEGLAFARPALDDARSKSAAAWATAQDAAWDTTWDAAWAAWDDVWDAAYATCTALDAALDTARDTARDAAAATAGKKLQPTTRSLQGSALELLDRLIDCGKRVRRGRNRSGRTLRPQSGQPPSQSVRGCNGRWFADRGFDSRERH